MNSMRDIERIDNILLEIKTIWEEHPDLRLGQLLSNIISGDNLYYIEDEDLITYLKGFYK